MRCNTKCTLLLTGLFFILGLIWIDDVVAYIVCVGILLLFIDVHAVWRTLLILCFCKLRRRSRPKKLLDPNVFYVICLPTDVDFNLRLTHRRLLRECSFSRTEFWVENYVHDALKKLDADIRVEDCHVTYYHPIKLFEIFQIEAKILYWDETSLYLKQTVTRNKDNVVCACVLSSMILVGTSTEQLLDVCDVVKQKPVQPDIICKVRDLHDEMRQ